MGGIPGEVQLAPPERAGHAALQSDLRGPRELGDPRIQARLVY